MLCPSCHIPNRDNAKFCKRCGHILAVEIVAAGQETQLAETLPGAMPPSQIQPSDASGNAEPAGMSQQKTRSVPVQPAKDWEKRLDHIQPLRKCIPVPIQPLRMGESVWITYNL